MDNKVCPQMFYLYVFWFPLIFTDQLYALGKAPAGRRATLDDRRHKPKSHRSLLWPRKRWGGVRLHWYFCANIFGPCSCGSIFQILKKNVTAKCCALKTNISTAPSRALSHPYLPPKLFGVPYDFARSVIGCFLQQPNLPLPCAAPGAGSRYWCLAKGCYC